MQYTVGDYEYEKYVCTPAGVRDMIAQYGVAIIPSVLNNEEVEKMKDGMWETVSHLTSRLSRPVKRDEPETYRSFLDLMPMHSMLVQHWSIGHSQFAWDVRQNPRVVDVYAKIWDVDPADLLTSFDACSIHMPPEITKRGWYRYGSWLHTDQSFSDSSFKCIQSWVTGYDVNEGDATLAFLEGSNRWHEEFGAKYGLGGFKDDWYKLGNDEQHRFYEEKGCQKKCIRCPAGSMVLWDSRTIHSGQEAVKARSAPNFRCVVYVCMEPRPSASDKKTVNMYAKKRKAFDELRLTSHWPLKSKLFGKNPRTYGAELPDVPEMPKPVLTELGRRLAGF